MNRRRMCSNMRYARVNAEKRTIAKRERERDGESITIIGNYDYYLLNDHRICHGE